MATSTQKIVNTPITELFHLADVFANLPEYATRELDHNHVLSLAETDHTQWPSIQVVETNGGLAIIDGYHRVEALKRQTTIKFLESIHVLTDEMSSHEIEKKIREPLNESDNRTLTDLLDNTLIRAEIADYKNEKEVFKAALTANLKHGLPPKSKALVHIAASLYDITREDTPQPSQSEIARIVGISRAALSEYLLKRKKREEKEQKEAGKSSQEKEQEDKTYEKALKSADRFIDSLETIYEESPHAYTQIIQKLFPIVVDGMATVHADNNDKTYLDSIVVLLTSSDDFTSTNVPHVARLARALTGASKKLEKQYPSAKEISSNDE